MEAGLAQLVEQLICNHQVGSSSLSTSTITGNKMQEKCPECGFELPEGNFCPVCKVRRKK